MIYDDLFKIYSHFYNFGDITVKTKRQEYRKCLLPECEVQHNHNASFCCADHSREWDKRKKGVK
jgi:hypothetical protein